MKRNNIPIPEYESFDNEEVAEEYVKKIYEKEPKKLLYIKASGLCAGKGALKTTNVREALENIKMMKTFGEAGKNFLIEEGLIGEEYSYYAISDGKTFKVFKSAQDNKTINDYDEGEQTGGMGAISPARVTEDIEEKIIEEQVRKVIEGMKKEGTPFKGILYVGGIVNNRKIKTIEYNARWGDPECQVVLPALKNDYAEVVEACIEGTLDRINIELDDKARMCVVGASRGYPEDYSKAKNKEVRGIEEVNKKEGITILGAGIKNVEGRILTNGGRIFSIVGEGEDIKEAKKKAYEAMAMISIEGNNLHYRTDIGWRDIERIDEKSVRSTNTKVLYSL